MTLLLQKKATMLAAGYNTMMCWQCALYYSWSLPHDGLSQKTEENERSGIPAADTEEDLLRTACYRSYYRLIHQKA